MEKLKIKTESSSPWVKPVLKKGNIASLTQNSGGFGADSQNPS